MKISILIATYNRCEILNKTLENLTRLDKSGIELEIVIVNNNSSDNTEKTIESYKNRLPIVHLTQTSPGKNKALNLGLDETELGECVVFTDDDVDPPKNWLQSISQSLANSPDIYIFGGPVHMIWPENSPRWAKELEMKIYPQHFYGDSVKVYEDLVTPIGPNFWVKKEIFTQFNFRYDESIGPTPDIKKRIMGSETSFLRKLVKEGFPILHIPQNSVGHYVTDDQMTPKYILNRAKTHGRFLAHLGRPFKDPKKYENHPIIWRCSKYLAVLKNFLAYYGAYFSYNKTQRLAKQVEATRWLAFNQAYIKNHRDIWDKNH